MSLEEADEIRMAWGKFLEVGNGGLLKLFGAQIPESLLPYSKERIEEALDLIIKHCYSTGDTENANVFEATKAMLLAYVPDIIALKSAAKRFNNLEFIKVYTKK